MIILDSSTKLQAVFAGAITTTNPKVIVSYGEETATTKTFGLTTIATNGVTAVDILGAPSSSTWRLIKSLQLNNTDTASVTVTIRTNISAALATIFKATLAVGETLIYGQKTGWCVLDKNGQFKVSNAVLGSYRLLNVIYLTSVSGSYTPSIGTTAIEIEMIGGGGGGGATSNVNANFAAFGGGACGGYLRKFITSPQLTAMGYVVGTGGSGGSGTSGLDTTFTCNSITYTAKGGSGGGFNTASAPPNVFIGGAGVIPTNGDLNIKGVNGWYGVDNSSTVGFSGNGGSIFGGAGKAVNVAGSNGVSGTANSGAGGSGGFGTGTAITGGTGGSGLIIIHEYM